jgi:hypothetical protein
MGGDQPANNKMNTKQEHTPGPWELRGLRLVTDKHGVVIAENVSANARLIAAAPELLAALEYIVGWNSHAWNTETARDLARAAIAKARGGEVNVKAIAHRIFKRLDEDIGDRRGIKHEWDAISREVMNGEIRPTWQRIITEEVEREMNKPLNNP